MKSSYMFRLSYLFSLLLLLQYAYCEKDFKSEFRVKFGDAVKGYFIDFMKTDIEILKNFYTTILNVASPNAEEVTDLNRRINELNNLVNSIDSKDTADLVQTITSGAIDNYKKMFSYTRDTHVSFTDENLMKVQKLTEDMKPELRKESGIFAMKIYKKWMEMYPTIPKEEHDKHPEYEEINELMQILKDSDGHSSVFLDISKLLVTFFQYNNWKFILEIDPGLGMTKVL